MKTILPNRYSNPNPRSRRRFSLLPPGSSLLTRRSSLLLAIAAIAMILSTFAGLARADDASDALKKRLADRYPALRAAKDAGKVGETFDGFVAAVDPKYLDDPGTKKLIDDENADRKQAYQIIADQTKTSPDVVGQRAGVHNFADAHPGDYLRDKDGKWTRK
jgi:uncharacterized protein YdbL (DUF1318 family)